MLHSGFGVWGSERCVSYVFVGFKRRADSLVLKIVGLEAVVSGVITRVSRSVLSPSPKHHHTRAPMGSITLYLIIADSIVSGSDS